MFSRRLFFMLELVSIGGAEPGGENVFSAPFQRIGLKEEILHTYVLYGGLPVLQVSQGSDRRVAGVGAIQWRALNLLFNFGSSPFAKIVVNFLIITNHNQTGNPVASTQPQLWIGTIHHHLDCGQPSPSWKFHLIIWMNKESNRLSSRSPSKLLLGDDHSVPGRRESVVISIV